MRGNDGQRYRCAACGKWFLTAWTDEEAIAERERLFPGVEPEEFAVICDDCFKRSIPNSEPMPMRCPTGEPCWLNVCGRYAPKENGATHCVREELEKAANARSRARRPNSA